MPDALRLFERPTPRHFTATQRSALEQYLAESARHTQIIEVASLGDLLLSPQGQLANGYRYSATAYRQICSQAVHGLRQVTVLLSGAFRMDGESTSDYSFAEAVQIFNMVVRRRFEAMFVGKVSLVLNQQDRMVDGILGPRTVYMENADLFELVSDVVLGSSAPVDFHEATVTGRRLWMRFLARSALVSVHAAATPALHRGGYHFSNNSIAGESVRAAAMLYRDLDQTAAIGNFFGSGRVRHTGQNFNARVRTMFRRLLERFDRLEELVPRLERLPTQLLGMTGSLEERDKRMEQLTTVLYRQGLPKGLSRQIIQGAVLVGSDLPDEARMNVLPNAATFASRTAYDVYVAASRESRNLSEALREAAERFAFSLLTGKIKGVP